MNFGVFGLGLSWAVIEVVLAHKHVPRSLICLKLPRKLCFDSLIIKSNKITFSILIQFIFFLPADGAYQSVWLRELYHNQIGKGM